MTDVLAALRQPEYTGENRCLPCTAVNLFIGFLLALAVLLAAIVMEAHAVALPLSIAVLVLAAVVIYLRGYLIPGTPELTKRYFPPWLLALFDKAPEPDGFGGATGTGSTNDADEDRITDVDPETLLLEAGAVEPCADVDDLCLTDAFADAWRDSLAEVRASGTDRDRLLTVLDAADLEPTFEERGDAFWARAEGRRIGTWESRAAFLADVAAAPLLADRLDQWTALSVPARGRLLNGLRLFLEECPECHEALSFDTQTVESCCSTHEVAALSCEACGARLFESEPL